MACFPAGDQTTTAVSGNGSVVDGKLLLFCGPSGSGKTTIVRHLLQQHPHLQFSISATTRARRPNETDGIDYHFITVDDFKEKIERGEFIEWEEVYHNGFYGTLKAEIERIWKMNKVVVFDVDVEGGLNIKQQFGNRLLAVFVMPPSIEVLHQRLKARSTETNDSLSMRIRKADHELTYAYRFDKIIINDDLDAALAEAEQLMNEFLAP